MAECSLEECFREHFPRLVALGESMTGDTGVAHELAQESFIRLHDRWDSVSAYERPGRWPLTTHAIAPMDDPKWRTHARPVDGPPLRRRLSRTGRTRIAHTLRFTSVRYRHVRGALRQSRPLDIAITDSGRRRTAPHAGSRAGLRPSRGRECRAGHKGRSRAGAGGRDLILWLSKTASASWW